MESKLGNVDVKQYQAIFKQYNVKQHQNNNLKHINKFSAAKKVTCLAAEGMTRDDHPNVSDQLYANYAIGQELRGNMPSFSGVCLGQDLWEKKNIKNRKTTLGIDWMRMWTIVC